MGWGMVSGFRKELLPEKIPGYFFCKTTLEYSNPCAVLNTSV